MTNIFTYGSLMFDSVWSKVVAGSYDRLESVLQGYDRKGVYNEFFPVVVPATFHSQVRGIVYRNVSISDLDRLDQFEGEYYFRKTEKVITLELRILAAEVYVLKEEYYSIISPQGWDPVHFSTTGIHSFMHSYMGGEKQ